MFILLNASRSLKMWRTLPLKVEDVFWRPPPPSSSSSSSSEGGLEPPGETSDWQATGGSDLQVKGPTCSQSGQHWGQLLSHNPNIVNELLFPVLVTRFPAHR